RDAVTGRQSAGGVAGLEVDLHPRGRAVVAQRVDAGTADIGVVAPAREQEVVAGAEIDAIVAATILDGVVAAAGLQRIGAARSVDRVVARVRSDGRLESVDRVIGGPAAAREVR